MDIWIRGCIDNVNTKGITYFNVSMLISKLLLVQIQCWGVLILGQFCITETML